MIVYFHGLKTAVKDMVAHQISKFAHVYQRILWVVPQVRVADVRSQSALLSDGGEESDKSKTE